MMEKKKMTIIGIGPGDSKYLTTEAKNALENMDIIIGSERQLEAISSHLSKSVNRFSYSGHLSPLKVILETFLYGNQSLGILASGDPAFYGISDWLKKQFPDVNFHQIAGISSAQILFTKANKSMHDVYMTSLHGRLQDLDTLFSFPRVCLLTDSNWSPYAIAQAYLNKGLNPLFTIGENLSYSDECITVVHASEVQDQNYKMSVVIIEHVG